jgi:hypothetical protein
MLLRRPWQAAGRSSLCGLWACFQVRRLLLLLLAARALLRMRKSCGSVGASSGQASRSRACSF